MSWISSINRTIQNTEIRVTRSFNERKNNQCFEVRLISGGVTLYGILNPMNDEEIFEVHQGSFKVGNLVINNFGSLNFQRTADYHLNVDRLSQDPIGSWQLRQEKNRELDIAIQNLANVYMPIKSDFFSGVIEPSASSKNQ